MVINESFMLQIKHFHLCADGVAVRKDLKNNCFSLFHIVDQRFILRSGSGSVFLAQWAKAQRG